MSANFKDKIECPNCGAREFLNEELRRKYSESTLETIVCTKCKTRFNVQTRRTIKFATIPVIEAVHDK